MTEGKFETQVAGPPRPQRCLGCGAPSWRVLTFDEFEVSLCPRCDVQGLACPVRCGRCCEELWDRVPVLAKRARVAGAPAGAGWRAGSTGRGAGRCPNHQPGRLGCELARPDMPRECRLWVCALGLTVLRDLLVGVGPRLSKREVRRIVREKLQWEPGKWKKTDLPRASHDGNLPY